MRQRLSGHMNVFFTRSRRRTAAFVIAGVLGVTAFGAGIWYVNADDAVSTDAALSEETQEHVANSLAVEDGDYRFYDENGDPAYGWRQIGDGVYYFDEDGVMVFGVQDIDGVTYSFTDDGRLASTSDLWWVLEDGADAPTAYTGDGRVATAAEISENLAPVSYVAAENVLPAGLTADPSFEETAPDTSDWWKTASVDAVRDKVLAATVWRNVVTGQIFYGVDGLQWGFNDNGYYYGGLELLSNPYAVDMGMSFTGTRYNVSNTTAVYMSWTPTDSSEAIEIGSVDIATSDALDSAEINRLYGMED